MLTKVFLANTIDKAVEQILDELKKDAVGTPSSSSGGRRNVIYFDGWDGLGASAVLRAVGRRLTPEAGRRAPAATSLEFSRIFHIDCSKWESRRAMQRVIVQELNLPKSVMEMLDAQDEEDDFRGVAKGSRTEIPRVTEAIYHHIQVVGAIYEPHVMNRRFLVIFHNGSSEEIDLDSSFSFPLSEYSRNKVLWSFQGRFRAYPRAKVDGALKNTRTTDVFLSAASSDIGENELCDILRHEAEEVAHEMINAGSGIDWRAAAADCFLYMLKICRTGNDLATDYDLATHVCNYWKCDGIIHLQPGDVATDDGVDKLWQSYDALQREIRLDACHFQNPYFPSPVEGRLLKRMAYWSSPTYGFMLMPDGHIPRGMFQQFDQLCVLKLSGCKFSFTSPPFLCCHNIRFLWLDSCQDRSWASEAVKEEDIARFFQRLWVLDVRYLHGAFLSKAMMDLMSQLRELNVMGEDEWLDTDLLQRRMHKIHRLRVEDSRVISPRRSSICFSGMDKMELLEFSSRHFFLSVSVESSCSNLETVVISGPSNLQRISLTGYAKLKNIFLSGSFPELYGIDITGAAVETLDLSAVMVPNLKVLLLRACGKLCSILWPPPAESKSERYLYRLHINTTRKEGTAAVATGREFRWHISVRDARILRSLGPVKDYFGPNDAHVEISSPTHLYGSEDNQILSSGDSSDSPAPDGSNLVAVEIQRQGALPAPGSFSRVSTKETPYADINLTSKPDDEGDSSDSPAPATMAVRPPSPSMQSQGCYLHIEDHLRTKSQAASITLPGFICDGTKILHVHDSLHITSILAAPVASSAWNQLELCRVEGCPKLECVFSEQLAGGPEGSGSDIFMFEKLRTTWASHLPNTRNIWKWSGPSKWGKTLLRDITLLQLECCPRLISIIDVPFTMGLNNLETLEIMWCGDLSVAFHIYNIGRLVWILPMLKHIHLHELPKLWNIGNTDERISAPKLETIKIRGCWSLRTLPVVRINKVVVCDCEKEWWDRLVWESEDHASHYKPIHPRYYKKTMLRGSILR